MNLTVGITQNGDYIGIEDCDRGKSDLQCPFCQGLLVAKKGNIKEHHFSHLEESCNGVASLRSLPGFDDFTLSLSHDEFETLQTLWKQSELGSKGLARAPESLVKLGMLQENIFRSMPFEFTKRGKIPVGGLSLNLFSQLHPELLLDAHRRLVELADYYQLETDKVALSIYRAQLRRLAGQHLYFLSITADDEELYKIGLTSRPLADRLPEIKRDLQQFYSSIIIKPLVFKEHRGHCERYFKYRYSANNVPVGTLTEYFSFDAAEAKKIISDLKRIPQRVFTATEEKIMRDWWRKEERRLVAVRQGVKKAKKMGAVLGRPKGSAESIDRYLSKPTNQLIAKALADGLSIRDTATMTGASTRTVQRVKRVLLDQRRDQIN
ncbi:GIY-YIG nuclease family protein [Neptuniibacter halophilus]|uniref:GIY-YIG nuclease family protein n=1 Tax=Neptuniibacter halophilus TaxID=651666 RepID=UPI00257283D6|nr:GIY-YIG nuclease family protein [Neptuniibacter halophilus]